MNDFTIYQKKGRMIMLAFLSCVFVLAGILFIGISMSESLLWMFILGIITAVFFGLCAIFYFKEIFMRKPAVIISDEGIVDRSSFIGTGLIKWEEIREIDLIPYGGQLFLGIFTSDPELIIKRSSGIKRLLNNINKYLLPSQVNIPVNNLSCSIDDLTNELNNRMMAENQDHND